MENYQRQKNKNTNKNKNKNERTNERVTNIRRGTVWAVDKIPIVNIIIERPACS